MKKTDITSPETQTRILNKMSNDHWVAVFFSFFKFDKTRSFADNFRLKLSGIYYILDNIESNKSMAMMDKEEKDAYREGRNPNYALVAKHLWRWGFGVKLFERIHEASDLYASEMIIKRGMNVDLNRENGIHYSYKAEYCIRKMLEKKFLRRILYDKYLSPDMRLVSNSKSSI